MRPSQQGKASRGRSVASPTRTVRGTVSVESIGSPAAAASGTGVVARGWRGASRAGLSTGCWAGRAASTTSAGGAGGDGRVGVTARAQARTMPRIPTATSGQKARLSTQRRNQGRARPTPQGAPRRLRGAPSGPQRPGLALRAVTQRSDPSWDGLSHLHGSLRRFAVATRPTALGSSRCDSATHLGGQEAGASAQTWCWWTLTSCRKSGTSMATTSAIS